MLSNHINKFVKIPIEQTSSTKLLNVSPSNFARITKEISCDKFSLSIKNKYA